MGARLPAGDAVTAMARWRRAVAKAERIEREMIAAGKFPAVPPNDYRGTQADWMIGLQERGWWDGKHPEFHGDVWLTSDQYDELLSACEDDANPRGDREGGGT